MAGSGCMWGVRCRKRAVMTEQEVTWRPDWPLCGSSGCFGLRRGDQEGCLAHVSSEARGAILAALKPGADLDLRGTPMDRELLSQILVAVRPKDGLPTLGNARFDRAQFTGDANFRGTHFTGRVEFQGGAVQRGRRVPGRSLHRLRQVPGGAVRWGRQVPQGPVQRGCAAERTRLVQGDAVRWGRLVRRGAVHQRRLVR